MTLRLRPLSRFEVRELDRRALEEISLPTLILMENAGRGAADWLANRIAAVLPSANAYSQDAPNSFQTPVVPSGRTLPKILILCGPGNNGGDGAVVARHLDAWGIPVQVIWFTRSDQLRGDAALQWTILARSGVDQRAWFDANAGEPTVDSNRINAVISDADWLVDGLLGTGLSRAVEGPIHTVIDAMNKSGKPIFALDVPSGLDADTGRPLGLAVQACATATFVAPKLGFAAPGAVNYTGEVAVIDIGLPRRLLEPYFCGN